MESTRIIKRTSPLGMVTYVIQQKHFLYRWRWVDAWMNHGFETEDSFSTLEEAQRRLPLFTKKWIDEPITTTK
jgi:hypothetical protein